MSKYLFALALIFHGCGGDDGHEEEADHHAEEEGEPSGAECDPAVTWDNFGMAFMASYCATCHSSTLTGPARNGAPEGHDFDTENGVLAVAEHIDEHAAAGPDVTNDEMPPSGAQPTQEEREQLGKWLACTLNP